MNTSYSHLARPSEWTVSVARGQIGVIRLLDVGRQEVFRAVTWAEASAGRSLIGYFESLEDASTAVWVTWANTKATPTELAVGSAQRVNIPSMPLSSKLTIVPSGRSQG